MSVIDEATEFQRELATRARAFSDAAFIVENALRNARIARVGSGILHRAPPDYDTAVENVAKALTKAKERLSL